jgi:hypothetical protein
MYTNCNSETVSAGEFGVEMNIYGVMNTAGVHSLTEILEPWKEIDVKKLGLWLPDGRREQLEDYKILDVQSFLEHEVRIKGFIARPPLSIIAIVKRTSRTLSPAMRRRRHKNFRPWRST